VVAQVGEVVAQAVVVDSVGSADSADSAVGSGVEADLEKGRRPGGTEE
jgi:hypothetical protein